MPEATVVQAAAVAAAALIIVVVAFQVALAGGARWGAAAYGGRAADGDGRLPARYRIGSAAAAGLLTGSTWVVLIAGSVVDRGPVPEAALTPTMWALAALFAANTAGNARGGHAVERFGASAITAVLAVLSVVLAWGDDDS